MASYMFDLAVIGGGPAGLVAAKLAKGLGKKVLLIERDRIGGECTNTGCVPSKTLIKTAQLAYDMQHAYLRGLASCEPVSDSRPIMHYVRSVVEEVYQTHTPEKIRELGIEFMQGQASFVNESVLAINGQEITARNIIIATGSRPTVPPIPGLQEVPFLTNENFFDLEELPASLIVLGAGPVGIELASACNRLGVAVTLIEAQNRILPQEDAELVEILTNELIKDGMAVLTERKVVRVEKNGDGVRVISVDPRGNEQANNAEKILIAVGRTPSLADLHLENAGVVYTSRGICVDTYMRTATKNIYACGDCTGPYLFSHIAEYQASVATRNALIPLFKKKIDYSFVPWIIFSSPELAHTGLTEEQAREQFGDAIQVYAKEYKDIDRAHMDGVCIGKAKFICDKKGYILGAHILGKRAGELIHEVQVGRFYHKKLADFYPVLHAYPAYSDLIWQPAKRAYIDRLQNNFFIRLARYFVKK